MSVHGIALTLIATFFVAYMGWQIDLRERHSGGIIGFALGLLALIAGFSWMVGW